MKLRHVDPVSDRPVRSRKPKPWMLCLVALVTAIVIIAPAELITRSLFKLPPTATSPCLITDDPSTGFRAVPNSVCLDKAEEGPLVEYKFNNCGYRASSPCRMPKDPSVYKIVLVGSSFAAGFDVPLPQTFSALLPEDLSRRFHRRVQLYNEGFMDGSPRRVALNFQDALAEHPDTILWAVTPWDVHHAEEVSIPTAKDMAAKESAAAAGESFLTRLIVNPWNRFKLHVNARWRSKLLLQLFFSSSETEYVKNTLNSGEEAAYLKSPLDAQWRNNLQQFDANLSVVAAKAKAAGVPLVVVMIPFRAQAVMLSTGEWPANTDPLLLAKYLQAIVQSHGVTYIDILDLYKGAPNPELGYYPVNGHLNARGNEFVSTLIASRFPMIPSEMNKLGQASSVQGGH